MGGKSRKSGGVSRKLIAHIKSGKYSASVSKTNKTKNSIPSEKEEAHKTLFD